jgi:hypothetical protein
MEAYSVIKFMFLQCFQKVRLMIAFGLLAISVNDLRT